MCRPLRCVEVRRPSGRHDIIHRSGVILMGCEGAAPIDKRFAAQTFDEYTEPLTNAVIGSPSGVTLIPTAGESDTAQVGGAATITGPDGGLPADAGAPNPDFSGQ